MFCEMIFLGALWVTPVVFWIRLSWQRELGDDQSIVLLVALGHALLLSFVWGMAPDFRARPLAELMLGEHVVLAVAALLMHGVRWGVQRGRGLEPGEWRESSEIQLLSQYSMPLLLVVTTAVGLTMALGRLLDSGGAAWFAVGIGSAAVS